MNTLRSRQIFYPAIYLALPSILFVEFNIKDMESLCVDFLFSPRTRGQIMLDYTEKSVHTLLIGVIIIGK